VRTTILNLVVAGLVLGACGQSHAGDVEVIFEPRAPYYVLTAGGEHEGLVLGPVSKALTLMDVAVKWSERPAKRQLKLIKANRSAICSPGWFKKPERVAFARFSNPVYRDRPQVVVVRSEDAGVFGFTNIRQLFAHPTLRRGGKQGYSYGAEIDRMLEELDPKTILTSKGSAHLLKMLQKERFDYFLASPEEIEHLLAREKIDPASMTLLPMKGLSSGNERFLICSKAVDGSFINQFNAALKTVLTEKD